MEVKGLEDFLSLARTGNFLQSAAEMHITQSAFSQRIQALEQWVGVALIDRSTYPTRLTPAGERFREATRDATAALLKTRQDLRQARDADRKLLRLANQHSLAASFLGPWLTTLPLARDDLLARATADNLHDCVRELEEGNTDLLLCYTQAELPMQLDTTRLGTWAAQRTKHFLAPRLWIGQLSSWHAAPARPEGFFGEGTRPDRGAVLRRCTAPMYRADVPRRYHRPPRLGRPARRCPAF